MTCYFEKCEFNKNDYCKKKDGDRVVNDDGLCYDAYWIICGKNKPKYEDGEEDDNASEEKESFEESEQDNLNSQQE